MFAAQYFMRGAGINVIETPLNVMANTRRAVGAGLEDDETLSYQVGVQSGGRYRTFNFAANGYGPAQMLAAIETGMVGRIVDTTPPVCVLHSHSASCVADGGSGWLGQAAALRAGP